MKNPYVFYLVLSIFTLVITNALEADLPGADVEGIEDDDKIVFKAGDGENGQIAIELSEYQYCEACHATMEIGYRVLQARIRDLDHQIQDGPRQIVWDAPDMNRDICDEGMRGFKPQFPLGCKRIIESHAATMWQPWHGEHNNMRLLADHEFVHYKQTFCSKINACRVDRIPTVDDTPRRRTKCEACAELAADLRTVLRRWMYPPWNSKSAEAAFGGAVDLDIVLETHWCSTLAVRNYRPSVLESWCRQAIETRESQLRKLLAASDGKDETAAQKSLVELRKLLARRPIGHERVWEQVFCSKKRGIGMCEADGLAALHARWERAFEANVDLLSNRFELVQKHDKRNEIRIALSGAKASTTDPTNRTAKQAELELELHQIEDEIAQLERETPHLSAKVATLAGDLRQWTLPNTRYFSPRVEKEIEAHLVEEKANEEAKRKKNAGQAAAYARQKQQLTEMMASKPQAKPILRTEL